MSGSKEKQSADGCKRGGCASECCFGQIFKYYFNCFRQYACLGGRASRMEFASFFLVNLLVVFLFRYMASFLIPSSIGDLYMKIALDNIYPFLSFAPFFAVATRRFHDTGRSAWLLSLLILGSALTFIGWLFFLFVQETQLALLFFVLMLLDLVFLFFILFRKSDPLPNKYDLSPSRAYKDGTVLILLSALIYGFPIFAVGYVSNYVNQMSDPEILPATMDTVDGEEGAPALPGLTVDDIFGNGKEMNDTVTVIEDEEDEGTEVKSVQSGAGENQAADTTPSVAGENQPADTTPSGAGENQAADTTPSVE